MEIKTKQQLLIGQGGTIQDALANALTQTGAISYEFQIVRIGGARGAAGVSISVDVIVSSKGGDLT